MPYNQRRSNGGCLNTFFVRGSKLLNVEPSETTNQKIGMIFFVFSLPVILLFVIILTGSVFGGVLGTSEDINPPSPSGSTPTESNSLIEISLSWLYPLESRGMHSLAIHSSVVKLHSRSFRGPDLEPVSTWSLTPHLSQIGTTSPSDQTILYVDIMSGTITSILALSLYLLTYHVQPAVATSLCSRGGAA